MWLPPISKKRFQHSGWILIGFPPIPEPAEASKNPSERQTSSESLAEGCAPWMDDDPPDFSKATNTSLTKGGKKNNKHKQLRGIVPEMGGGQIVYVFPFFLGKKRKHINKIPRKSPKKAGTVPGQSRENFVFVFSCLLVFPGPIN